jgi:hypothetical protein
MAVYVPLAQRDISQDLEFVSEGDVVATPANFGSAPTNPAFAYFGKNQRFTYTDNPETFEIQTIDDENRTEMKKIRNSGTLTLDFDVTEYLSTENLDWFLSLNTTDFTSKMMAFSRNAGTEYWRLLNGCVPQTTTVTFPEDNAPVHVSSTILVTNPTAEGTTGPTLGSGSHATAISTDAICPSDGGLDSFDLNSVNYKIKGFEFTVEQLYSMVDADDSNTIQLMIPQRRTISGTVNVFQKQGADAIHADIFASTLRSMRRVLFPSTGTRFDFTNVHIAEDETNHSDIISDSIIKPYSFTAGTLTLTAL